MQINGPRNTGKADGSEKKVEELEDDEMPNAKISSNISMAKIPRECKSVPNPRGRAQGGWASREDLAARMLLTSLLLILSMVQT